MGTCEGNSYGQGKRKENSPELICLKERWEKRKSVTILFHNVLGFISCSHTDVMYWYGCICCSQSPSMGIEFTSILIGQCLHCTYLIFFKYDSWVNTRSKCRIIGITEVFIQQNSYFYNMSCEGLDIMNSLLDKMRVHETLDH